MRALSDSNALVRTAAGHSIGSLKAEAAPAMPRLIEMLSDNDVYVRRAAVFALGEIGPPAAAALGTVRAVARGDSNEVVSEARAATARIEGRPLPDSPPAGANQACDMRGQQKRAGVLRSGSAVGCLPDIVQAHRRLSRSARI